MNIKRLFFIGILTLTVMVNSQASQFRHFDAINPADNFPADYVALPAGKYQLNPRIIEHAIAEVAKSFRSPKLHDLLGERFNNRSQLVDDILTNLPFDATLRILSIQSPRVLAQGEKVNDDGKVYLLSRVAATVSSQLEFSSAENGFQILRDTSDWVLSLTTLRITPPIQNNGSLEDPNRARVEGEDE